MTKTDIQTKLVERTGEISEEKLMQEAEMVAKEILQQQEEARLKSLTNPSAVALYTTAHEVGEGIGKVKRNPKELFVLYLTNQFVARAVNIRADTLISRGYKIVGKDDKAVKACEELIENSGGINLFWQLSVNTDIAGDGFLEKIYNKKKNKILRLKHVHPLTLEFDKNTMTDKILVNEKGEPLRYIQYYVDTNGMEQTKPVPIDRIAHLRFNTLGDEFTGISTIQPGYNTIVRLMNMEYSAAEAAVKIANPIIVGYCNTKSPHQIALWGTILGRINGQDQVFVPEGMKLDTLQPGQQNFNDYAAYFLDAVVSCFGVPKSILLGESASGSRAESVVLSRHFYSVIRSNQRYMEEFFYEVFKEYAEMAGFEAPRLVFEDLAEDAAVNAQSAIDLFTAGIIEKNEARAMIGLYPTKGGVQTEDAVKKADMEAWHPAEPGSPAGSQKGEKTKQKQSEFSEVSVQTE